MPGALFSLPFNNKKQQSIRRFQSTACVLCFMIRILAHNGMEIICSDTTRTLKPYKFNKLKFCMLQYTSSLKTITQFIHVLVIQCECKWSNPILGGHWQSFRSGFNAKTYKHIVSIFDSVVWSDKKYFDGSLSTTDSITIQRFYAMFFLLVPY